MKMTYVCNVDRSRQHQEEKPLLLPSLNQHFRPNGKNATRNRRRDGQDVNLMADDPSLVGDNSEQLPPPPPVRKVNTGGAGIPDGTNRGTDSNNWPLRVPPVLKMKNAQLVGLEDEPEEPPLRSPSDLFGSMQRSASMGQLGDLKGSKPRTAADRAATQRDLSPESYGPDGRPQSQWDSAFKDYVSKRRQRALA
jgi:hypothetical protein